MPVRRVFKIDLVGDKELQQVFDEIPKAVGDAAIRAALKKSLEPVASLARDLAPKDDGDTAASIKVSSTLSKPQRAAARRKGVVSMFVGPSHPKGNAGLLSEFGTAERRQKTGKSVGRMRIHAFMRPAWDALQAQALETYGKEIWAELVKQVRRLRKRAEKGTLSKSQERFFVR
jgi:HK97 gp10 family phage protein